MIKRLTVLFAFIFLLSPAFADQMNDLVAKYKSIGYAKSIDCQLHKTMVNPYLWESMDFDLKQNSTLIITEWCKQRGGRAALMTIRDNKNGKELGGVNWMGFYVK